MGAFIAGIVIGQTDVHRQVESNALPMRDAFVVIFFSVGMLFNPSVVVDHFWIFIGTLGIILIIKPLAAFFIALVFRQTLKTALVVAFALAQIGEFSFILAEEALKHHIFNDDGYDVIVACAIVSIALNPLLFRLLNKLVDLPRQDEEKTIEIR